MPSRKRGRCMEDRIFTETNSRHYKRTKRRRWSMLGREVKRDRIETYGWLQEHASNGAWTVSEYLLHSYKLTAVRLFFQADEVVSSKTDFLHMLDLYQSNSTWKFMCWLTLRGDICFLAVKDFSSWLIPSPWLIASAYANWWSKKEMK